MRRFFQRLLWFGLMLPGAVTYAATVANLYEATVPLERGHDAALQEALRTVIVRASGQRDAANQVGRLQNPRQYLRFESTNAGMLTAGFDSVSIDTLLADAGLPIWGRERPAVLMLVEIVEPTGVTRWLTAEESSPEREAVNRAAHERALPIVWPSLVDVSTQSIASDQAGLLAAAARYGAQAALSGRARRDALGGVSVQWTLGSQEQGGNTSGGLEEGVHLAADTFARAFAVSATSLANLIVQVSGVTNLDAYAETLNYLEGLTLVRTVAVEEVAGDMLRLRLTVRGDGGTLQRAIALGDRLAQNPEASMGADRLAFRYLP